MRKITILRLLTTAALVAAGVALIGCNPQAPTPVQSPTSSNTCTVSGQNNAVNCGNGNNQTSPTASPSPGSSGDNAVASYSIHCYGFGTQPGQTEPNHDLCQLPSGYPNIAVTASPKNKAGEDIPQPGDKTDPKVVDWTITPAPSGCVTLTIQADNRFNVTVLPASPRVDCSFTLVSTYKDPNGDKDSPFHVATKTGSIRQ